MIVSPSLDSLGRTSGCANRRMTDVEPELMIVLNAVLASVMVETVTLPILMSTHLSREFASPSSLQWEYLET